MTRGFTPDPAGAEPMSALRGGWVVDCWAPAFDGGCELEGYLDPEVKGL